MKKILTPDVQPVDPKPWYDTERNIYTPWGRGEKGGRPMNEYQALHLMKIQASFKG